MKKIAIIDDEIQITSMIEKYLKRNGDFSVTVYNNPLNAISGLSQDTDVVLLDIMMPQMNGLEVLEKLREKFPDLNIVMMTAYSTLDKVLEAHRQGAEDYIMKPFSSMSIITDKINALTK
ncbi:response regulator [Sulfurimonas sp.]|uniref:response regulator n=1 Tax=Sulfurimonas sp. TaxID=2022749 RepID=UPI003568F973